MNIYLGTSGYKFDDWIGVFYPNSIKKVEMLEYYVKHFNLLELTFTYYKMPSYGEIKNILDRSGSNTVFTIRLPHFFQKDKFTSEDVKNFYIAISPIIESNRLYALFSDFPYKFTACKKNFEYILKLKSTFQNHPLFVELPNRTWYKERFISDFRNSSIGLITLDLPPIVGFAPYYPFILDNKIYLRLYGKSELWLTPETKELSYNYPKNFLEKLANDIKKREDVENIAISFCNVVDGYAPLNALDLKDMIRGKNSEKNI
ncbi:MAG: DUF72 domain-containing protein [Calditerrivibrio sp.]|nr:DUF72 domain-containing protein [Calditerrivibrio sp.]